MTQWDYYYCLYSTLKPPPHVPGLSAKIHARRQVFCPSGDGADAVWLRGRHRGHPLQLSGEGSEDRKMAPSGGVSGSVLGRVAVELQHLQWVDVIRSTAKTSERYVMSCMRNLHTILVRRVISGELFRFLGTNLETKHLVSDSWVIALCFYSWSSDQPKSETGLKPRFPQNRFSINPVDI